MPKSKILLGILVLFIVGVFFKLIYTMINEQVTVSQVPLGEYNDLFKKEALSKLKLLATTKSKNRQPTSTYIYDEKFNVFVIKEILKNDYSLKSIIDYLNKSSSISMNAVYSGLANYNMDMNIKAGKSVLVSRVHFKYNGDFIDSIQKTDSLYCYYFKFKTFSLHYNDELYAVIAKADKATLPASLVFIKKGKFLYIVIMCVANGKEEMQPDQLCAIIKGCK